MRRQRGGRKKRSGEGGTDRSFPDIKCKRACELGERGDTSRESDRAVSMSRAKESSLAVEGGRVELAICSVIGR